MLKVTDLKAGKYITIGGSPFEVLEYSHAKLGRGGAIVKTKLKNLKTGAVLEKNFKGQEKIEEASLNFKSSQFLYADDDNFYFMDQNNFNQFSIPKEIIGRNANFLKSGGTIEITFLYEKPINIKLPIKIDFKISETEPGVKGDTASAATKEAAIETGFRLQVPLFIKTGDIIRVDTRSGDYIERVT